MSRDSTEKYIEEEMGKINYEEIVENNRVCTTGQTMATRGCNICLQAF